MEQAARSATRAWFAMNDPGRIVCSGRRLISWNKRQSLEHRPRLHRSHSKVALTTDSRNTTTAHATAHLFSLHLTSGGRA